MERRIIVFAPTGQDAPITERLFNEANIAVVVCDAENNLADLLMAGAAALLIVEEALTPPVQNTLQRYLAKQEHWSDLPVLLLTKRGANSMDVQKAIERLGNVTLLERPVRTTALISSAKSALRARARQYQARTLDKRKDEFLATLAHELRNPLSPILNATHIFERQHPSDQTTRMVAMVRRQIDHLTRLIDDLMDVARITSGKLKLQISPTSVGKIVTQALEIASGTVVQRKHELEVTVSDSDSSTPMTADHVRLVQILANVLVNAAKFTPVGGKIVLSTEVDSKSATFRVKDTGRGLSPEEIDKIFEMFSQSRAVGEPSTGLGMGLHLARVFSKMHAGSIEAFSDGKGKGSEFVIKVPLNYQGKEALRLQDNASERTSTSNRRVLVVDDNRDATDTLSTILASAGMTTFSAYDGSTAVEMERSKLPHIVIMDIGMKPMNGYEAVKLMRARAPAENGHRPTIVALTGWGQFTDQALAKEAGFDHHFVKPVDVKTLLDFIASSSKPA